MTAHAEPTILRCADTADFLVALPRLTGFSAPNSLTLVLFAGRRATRAVRVDLPPSEEPRETAPYLDAVCRLLRDTEAGPHGPALVITTDRTFAERGTVPWQRLARRLERRIELEGWWLREFACVAADGWVGYREATARPRGYPLSDLRQRSEHLAARHPAPEGSAVERWGVPAIAELGRLPTPDPELAARVAERLAAQADAAGSRANQARPGPEADLVAGARRAVACVGRALDGTAAPSAATLARLALDAEVPSRWLAMALTVISQPAFVHDVITDLGAAGLARLASGTPQAPSTDVSLAGFLAATAEEQPDRASLRRATDALAHAAAHVPDPHRAGVLALLAWTWWLLGLQSVAHRVLELAGGSPPPPVVGVVRQVIRQLPGWHLRDG